jgi:hypothetical protein
MHHIQPRMRTPFEVAALFVVTCVLIGIAGRLGASSRARADDAAKPETKDAAVGARLREMTDLAKTFKVSIAEVDRDVPATLVAEPLHRWTDPARKLSDGTLWSFSREGRPIAILSLEHHTNPAYNALWSFELATLSAKPLAADGGQGFQHLRHGPNRFFSAGPLRWTPEPAALKVFPKAAAPAAGEAERLRQMKELARRFTAFEVVEPAGVRYDLRLMPRPIHRFQAPAARVVDGAIFLFAFGTNPEVILLIEANKGKTGEAAWQYGFGRLTSAAPAVSLDKQEVWSEVYKPIMTAPDPYYNGWLAREK